MPLGRRLTMEEIAAIQHEITPIGKVHKISQSTTYLEAEQSRSKMAKKYRGESVNKGRG